MTPPQEIVDEINANTSFISHIHTAPDADSIGSTLALKLALESQGKILDLFCEDSLPDFAYFLPGIDEVITSSLKNILSRTSARIYLSLDTAKWPLATHEDPPTKISFPVINIDHHLDNSIRSNYKWVEPSASSTSELVYHLLLALKYDISPQIATCLLFGLMGDTHAFNNYNSNAQVLRLGADLIDLGADYLSCLTATTRSLPFDFIKTWELLIHHLTLSEDHSYVCVAIDHDTWKASAGGSIGVFANELICRITGTAFGAILVEKKEGITTCSLRSRDTNFDVSLVAAKLGGGGHKHSASFRLAKPLKQALLEFKNAVALTTNQ